MTFFELFKSSFLLLQKEQLEFSEFDLRYFICSIFDISHEKFLLTYHDHINDHQKLDTFHQSFSQLLKGCPMAYLLESELFFSRSYYCPQGVLIPRCETELLVEQVSAYISKLNFSECLVFECGSGTGCISIELALRHSQISVKSFDIDLKAIDVAKKNAEKFAVPNVTFFHGDFFDYDFSKISTTKNVILVSNPPYVSEKEWDQISLGIKNHEPKQAFVSSKNGFDHLFKLIDISTTFSFPSFFEIGFNQSDTLFSYVNKRFNPYFIKDYQGINRVLCIGDLSETS